MMIFEDWSVTWFRAACLRIENTTGWDLLALAWGVLCFLSDSSGLGYEKFEWCLCFQARAIYLLLGRVDHSRATTCDVVAGSDWPFVSIILKYTHFTLITVS